VTPAWLHPLLSTPLDPSPDRARSLLRRELLRPEYNDRNPVQRVMEWLQRMVNSALEAASNASALPVFGAILVFLVLLVLLGLLLSRARRSGTAADGSRAVLNEERLTATQLRARADAALAAGRAEEALVEGFRALTTRQIERGRLDDVPGATAHEVAESLAANFPRERPRVDDSARLFDLVLYGDRPATPEQATRVLALDDELAVVR